MAGDDQKHITRSTPQFENAWNAARRPNPLLKTLRWRITAAEVTLARMPTSEKKKSRKAQNAFSNDSEPNKCKSENAWELSDSAINLYEW